MNPTITDVNKLSLEFHERHGYGPSHILCSKTTFDVLMLPYIDTVRYTNISGESSFYGLIWIETTNPQIQLALL